ncbi:MAG: hypothetical protein AAGA48_20810 [Myxococcota bacterium]
MSLPKSFLSGAPVVSLQGQWMHLAPYLLKPEDDARKQNQFGTCYSRELIASPWGAFYGEVLRRHALQRGLLPLGRYGNWEVFRYPSQPQIDAIRDDGYELTLPLRTPRQVDGAYRLAIDEAFNLVLDDHPDGISIMASLQAGLRADGTVPIWDVLTALGVTDLVWEAPLRHGVFQRDDEELIYWTPTGLAARAAYDLDVPPDLVAVLPS